jgi:hypothetical protein
MENPDVVLEFNTVKSENGEKLTMSYKNASRKNDEGKSGLEFIAICQDVFGYEESEEENGTTT